MLQESCQELLIFETYNFLKNNAVISKINSSRQLSYNIITKYYEYNL